MRTATSSTAPKSEVEAKERHAHLHCRNTACELPESHRHTLIAVHSQLQLPPNLVPRTQINHIHIHLCNLNHRVCLTPRSHAHLYSLNHRLSRCLQPERLSSGTKIFCTRFSRLGSSSATGSDSLCNSNEEGKMKMKSSDLEKTNVNAKMKDRWSTAKGLSSHCFTKSAVTLIMNGLLLLKSSKHFKVHFILLKVSLRLSDHISSSTFREVIASLYTKTRMHFQRDCNFAGVHCSVKPR